MLTFKYRARDAASGEEVKSTIQAQSQSAAAKLLVEQGLSPLDIHIEGQSRSPFKRDKVRAKEKVIFFRQLATLINAGLPLVQSLRTVSGQIDNKLFGVVISDVISSVEAGNTFSSSLEKHPKIFNNVMVSLIAAGEASGTLDNALERIAFQTEKDAEIASKVKGALVYPAIVLVVILGVVIFMLTTVLPQVELLYEDLGQNLPFITGVMLAISDFIVGFWWAIILTIAVGIFFLRRYAETDIGARNIDSFKLSVPLFGKMFKKLYMARFSRTGSTLLNSGVPMLEMLRINAHAVNNVLIADEIMVAVEKVKGGKALSDALEGSDHFLDLVPQMIRIGEQSGSIDGMMSKSADFFENELDNEIKTISTTIEPVLMVFLALVAGLMVGAILIPVYGLVGNNLAV